VRPGKGTGCAAAAGIATGRQASACGFDRGAQQALIEMTRMVHCAGLLRHNNWKCFRDRLTGTMQVRQIQRIPSHAEPQRTPGLESVLCCGLLCVLCVSACVELLAADGRLGGFRFDRSPGGADTGGTRRGCNQQEMSQQPEGFQSARISKESQSCP